MKADLVREFYLFHTLCLSLSLYLDMELFPVRTANVYIKACRYMRSAVWYLSLDKAMWTWTLIHTIAHACSLFPTQNFICCTCLLHLSRAFSHVIVNVDFHMENKIPSEGYQRRGKLERMKRSLLRSYHWAKPKPFETRHRQYSHIEWDYGMC